MPAPVYGRSGRVVPPSGLLTYPIAVALPHKLLSGVSVRVLSASFPGGAGVSEPPVDVGRLAARRVPDEVGVPVWETLAEIHNTLDRPVDAVFLAQCDEPAGAQVLLPLRLAPGERSQRILREVQVEPQRHDAPRILGLAVNRLALVDWSAIEDEGGAAASRALSAAWDRWLRWEGAAPLVRGRFRLRASPASSGADLESAGTFVLGPGGRVSCSPDAAVDPEHLQLAQRAIREAFADLLRPAASEAVPPLSTTLVERTPRRLRVRVQSPLVGGQGPAEVHHIEDGVLTGWECPEEDVGIHESWTTEKRGDGFLVTSRDLFQRAVGAGKRATDARRWAYGEAEGRIVPVRYARSEWYVGDRASETVVELEQHAFEGEAPRDDVLAAPPEVRTAWDAAYRYPHGRVLLEARFEVENAGNDDIWGGVKRVAGRLRLRGFTGMRGSGRSWDAAEIEIEGDRSPEKARALAAVVEDRLWIWAKRDFGGRDSFDVAFRGARVTPRHAEAGTYDVENGPCTFLRLHDGRVVAWDPPDVRAGTLEYTPAGGATVHTLLRNGGATSRVEVLDLGGGWTVPVRMRFDGTLGPGWGPESVTLTDVRITAEVAR